MNWYNFFFFNGVCGSLYKQNFKKTAHLEDYPIIWIQIKKIQIPSTTPFGSQFSFHPASGRLEVDAQETIEIDFCPNILGEFHETFHWELSSNNKSACTIPISFKGIFKYFSF